MLKARWRRCAGSPGGGNAPPRVPVHAAPRVRHDFNKESRIPVNDFMDLVTAGFPDAYARRLGREDADLPRCFTVEYEGENYSHEYSIDFEQRIVDAGMLESRGADRATGRRMFAHLVLAGMALGFGRLELTAGRSMGAYVWSRMGVFIRADSRKELTEKLRLRLDAIKGRLTPEQYDAARRLTALRRRKDLHRIANLDLVLEDAQDEFDAAFKKQNSYSTLNYAFYVLKGFFKDRAVTLGQFLLAGQSYDGWVDLNNPRQLKRIEDYTGVKIRKMFAQFTAPCAACPNQPTQCAVRSWTPASRRAPRP